MAWRQSWNQPTGGGRYRHIRFGTGGRPRGLWVLIIITVLVFLLVQGSAITEYGTLDARAVFEGGQVWRLVTFQFLHAGFGHIFFNMFMLWMFGRIVQMQIGTRRFVWLYLLAGIAGGLAQCAFGYAVAEQVPGYLDVPTVGASAGVMGIGVAFALINPNAMVYLFFILPIRAKWLAVGYFVLETWPMLNVFLGGPIGHVAHAAHVGGMVYALGWAVVAGYVRHPVALRAQRFVRGFVRKAKSRAQRKKPRKHPVVRGPNAYSPRGPSARDERKLDEVLRKIHGGGLASLSEEERDFLRKMSERRRDDVDFDNRYRRG